MNFKSQTTVAGLAYILLGILCIVLGGSIINVLAIAAGALLMAFGIFNLTTQRIMEGVSLLVIGALIILTGWLMVSILFYVIAAAMIIMGVQGLIIFTRNRSVNDSFLRPEALRPILLIVCGILFIINQVGALNVIFTIIGVIFIISGILAIADSN